MIGFDGFKEWIRSFHTIVAESCFFRSLLYVVDWTEDLNVDLNSSFVNAKEFLLIALFSYPSSFSPFLPLSHARSLSHSRSLSLFFSFSVYFSHFLPLAIKYTINIFQWINTSLLSLFISLKERKFANYPLDKEVFSALKTNKNHFVQLNILYRQKCAKKRKNKKKYIATLTSHENRSFGAAKRNEENRIEKKYDRASERVERSAKTNLHEFQIIPRLIAPLHIFIVFILSASGTRAKKASKKNNNTIKEDGCALR